MAEQLWTRGAGVMPGLLPGLLTGQLPGLRLRGRPRLSAFFATKRKEVAQNARKLRDLALRGHFFISLSFS